MAGTLRLYGRGAIIVGADCIGCGIALALAQAGAATVVLDGDADVAAQAGESLRQSGLQCRVAHYARDDERLLIAAFQDSVSHLSSLQILVTNLLPEGNPTLLKDLLPDDVLRSLAAVAQCTQVMQAALPWLRSHGSGRIINVGNRYGDGINEGLGAYNAAAWGLWGLTRTAAVEWGQYGITSNLLMPLAATPQLHEAQQARPQLMSVLLGQLPLRRAGDPVADIGGAAVFLASDEAAYVNGETLYADGGQHIAGPIFNPAKFTLRS